MKVSNGLMFLIIILLASCAFNTQYNKREHLLHGTSSATQGDFGKAKKDFEKALKKDPFFASARIALKVLEDVSDNRIEKATAIHFFKGIGYSSKGMIVEEISELNRAIRNDPDYALVYIERGSAFYDIGQYDFAILDYTKAIEIDPTNDLPYYNRGNAYRHKGEYCLAISDYNKALEINPKDADVYANRGIAYSRKNRYEKAISDFEKAIEINPNLAAAYACRGFLRIAKFGEREEACSDWRKACDLGECRNYEMAKQKGYCQ